MKVTLQMPEIVTLIGGSGLIVGKFSLLVGLTMVLFGLVLRFLSWSIELSKEVSTQGESSV